MKTLQLAFRNLFRQKRRSAFLATAVGLGFAIIMLLAGLSGGLVVNIKENLSRSLGGHVFLKASEYNVNGKVVSKVSNPAQLEKAVAELGPLVLNKTKRSTVETTILFGSKSVKETVSGVPWIEEKAFRESLLVVEGSVEKVSGPQLVLGQKNAAKLGLAVGDAVLVKFKTLDGQQNVLDFTIAAVVKDSTGGVFSGSTYADLAQVNTMIGLEPTAYQSLNLYLRTMDAQQLVADKLEKSLALAAKVEPRESQGSGDPAQKMFKSMRGTSSSSEKWTGPKYSVSILNDLISVLMNLVTALQGVSTGIFLLVLGITIIGISNSFRMILRERFKEVGTLRALGMRRKRVRNLFLLEAVMLVALGMAGGGLLSVVIGFGLQAMPLGGQDFLLLFLRAGHLLLQPELGGLVLTCVVLLAAGLVAAWGPARTAAQLSPAEALRANN